MPAASSFGRRWARDNLTRELNDDEVNALSLFPSTCEGDETEASKRARRYYKARGPGGLTELWHSQHPDDDDILCSCQDAYILPLKARSIGGRRLTIVRMPAPTALDRPLSARSLLKRWLMILDIRLREDPTPGEEVVFIDVSDLQPAHLKNHFKGSYWRDFVWLMKCVYPLRFSEVHVINAGELKTMSLLLLHIGLYPWRKTVVKIHTHSDKINQVMGIDYFPEENLPFEYGGKAGAMKDLNDEWTRKLLCNTKWLQSEERKFYETELVPEVQTKTKIKSSVRKKNNASYDMLKRRISYRYFDNVDDGLYGAYRTLRVSSET